MAIIRETEELAGTSLSPVGVFVEKIMPPLGQILVAGLFYVGFRFCMNLVTQENISFHRASLIAMCFEGFISSVACVILFFLGAITKVTSSTTNDYRTDLFFLLTAGFLFSFACISSASAMDSDKKRKSLCMLCLIPVIHFVMEGVFSGTIETGAIHAVGLGMMVIGGLFMVV